MATGIYPHNDGSTYTVTFPNNSILTTVTSSGDAAAIWILETLCHNHWIAGLDIEWCPNFQRGGQVNKVTVIQICVGERCLIFQIINSDYIPQALADFLRGERFSFVGVGIHGDVDKLIQDYNLTVCYSTELKEFAAFKLNMPELRNTGLVGLVRVVMGIEMQKPRQITLSPWDRQNLTPQQIMYACADAFASCEVGRRLFYNEF